MVKSDRSGGTAYFMKPVPYPHHACDLGLAFEISEEATFPGRGAWKRADGNPIGPLPMRGIWSTPLPTTLTRKTIDVNLQRQSALDWPADVKAVALPI